MSDLLAPLLAAAVGVVLSAVIAYPLGRMQGRQQTLYEAQAEIISEGRKMVLGIEEALWEASHRPDIEDHRHELSKTIGAFVSYHQEKSIWLYPPQDAKITALIEGYTEQFGKLWVDPLSRADVGGPAFEVEELKASQETSDWAYVEGRRLVEELEADARTLLGTDRRPWWRRVFGG